MVIDADVAEWDYGEYEGRRSVDIARDKPGWSVWRDGCPGGEEPAEVSARADRVIERLCALRGRVAVFTHGQFGAALATRWIEHPLLTGQHFALKPASLSILAHDERHPGRRLITLWNQTTSSCEPG